MKLHFYNFLNYSSRRLKSYTTLDKYEDYYITTLSNVAFNPSNNVTTKQVVNYEFEDIGNYIIYTDDEDNIISRWYIMEAKRLRTGQYDLSLRRDVLADNYDKVLDSSAFVEKGAINDINNSLLYNNENMDYNQIKVQEAPIKRLKDLDIKWLVGYYSANSTLENEFQAVVNYDYVVDNFVNTNLYYLLDKAFVIVDENELSDNDYYFGIRLGIRDGYVVYSTTKTKFYSINNPPAFKIPLPSSSDSGYYVDKDPANPNYFNANTESINNKMRLLGITGNVFSKLEDDICNVAKKIVLNMLEAPFSYYSNDINRLNYIIEAYSVPDIKFIPLKRADYNQIINKYMKFAGKSFYSNTDDKTYSLYYKSDDRYDISLITHLMKETNFADLGFSFTTDSVMWTFAGVIFGDLTVQYGIVPVSIRDASNCSFQYHYENVPAPKPFAYDVKDGTASSKRYSYSIASGSLQNSNTGSYDMFAIPYSETHIINNCGGTSVPKLLVNDIILQYSGAGALYDVQMLPYFPFENNIFVEEVDEANITITCDLPDVYKSTFSVGGVDIEDFVFNINKNVFTFDIPLEDVKWNESDKYLGVEYSENDCLQKKIDNETLIYRISSPNYNGQFEFSPAKNNGLRSFNIDCTYKPYNPYIHINPNFSGLYGEDYNDSRGLICGGEFSYPLASNQWATYELQNKNYQNIFDRQIQNMEKNNSLNNIQAGISRATNVIGSAGFGAMFGGPIGAAIMGGASLVGGVADTLFDIEKQQEQLDYTKDLFGYQLGNIKALPNNITRTTSFTNNNKVYPLLEVYDCTDIEKEALRNKLKWNGWTINVIGKFKDYVFEDMQYIKGKIVDFSSFEEPTNVLLAINEEINKGVYYYDTRSND